MGDAASSSERTPLLSSTLKRGTYAPSGKDDLRSPCPLVNSLANHGYIPRDGRNVHASDFYAAMNEIGLSRALRAVFSQPIFNEYHDPKVALSQKRPGLFKRLWSIICNPWILLSIFGMRRRGQVDAKGKKVLDLDQLATHNVIEHDVSLCRRDYLQDQGNLVLQQDLVDELLASSKDGKKLTMEDLANFRKARIQQQINDNPNLEYGPNQHQLACGEIALILGVFGDGKSIPCEYARAFFKEERLPVKEGWKKRFWFTFGIIELGRHVEKIKSVIGLRL